MNKRLVKTDIMGILLAAGLFAVILLLILYPEKYIKSVYNGLLLFALNVLPSLFPFFFITKLLTSLSAVQSITKVMQKPVRKFLKLPAECSYILFMSVLSGYPVGAKLISEHYIGKKIDKVTRIAAICSTSGPLFVMGTVGFTMLGSRGAGFAMYFAHILSVLFFALVSGMFIKADKSEQPDSITMHKSDNILGESIYGSVISILTVGGFISIFYMLTDMVSGLFITGVFENLIGSIFSFAGIEETLSKGFISGFFEVTRGCLEISKTSAPLAVKTVFCVFSISFGGACIMLQSFAFLGKCGVHKGKFIFYKFIQAVLAALLCIPLCSLFNVL